MDYRTPKCPYCDIFPTTIVRDSVMEHEILCPMCQRGSKVGIDEVVTNQDALLMAWLEVVGPALALRNDGRCVYCGFWEEDEDGLKCEHCKKEEAA